MNNHQSSLAGFSLLEMVMASSLLAIILGITFSFYMTGLDTYKTGSAIVAAQSQLQIKLESITEELIETAESNMTIYSWADAQMGNQEALCFSSARDANDNFITSNGRPVWQSVVVYAPYANPTHNNRGEIRRYEDFGAHNFPLNITDITANTITLDDDTTFARGSGSIILGNVATLDAQALQIMDVNPISISIDVRVILPKGASLTIPLQTSVNCRN